MKIKRGFILLLILLILSVGGFWAVNKFQIGRHYEVGQAIDSLDGVYVYYNGEVSHVSGRNLAKDKYNLGLKYQCVEFVKRYYYEHLHHKMPDSYGHAKDFFDPEVKDGAKNKKRNLTQYRNSSASKPQVKDLLIFRATSFNEYGHVAIISEVHEDEIEIIQQNAGPNSRSRVTFTLEEKNGRWKIKNERALGWLRKN